MAHTYFTPPPIDGFPHVHKADPAQALDGFPPEVLQNWLSEPGFKLIIRIFDYDNLTYRSHVLPKDILAATLAAITRVVVALLSLG